MRLLSLRLVQQKHAKSGRIGDWRRNRAPRLAPLLISFGPCHSTQKLIASQWLHSGFSVKSEPASVYHLISWAAREERKQPAGGGRGLPGSVRTTGRYDVRSGGSRLIAHRRRHPRRGVHMVSSRVAPRVRGLTPDGSMPRSHPGLEPKS